MNDNYHQYIKRFFKLWAPVYDLVTMPIYRIRNKVADMIGAKKGLKVLDVCAGTGAQTFAFGKKGCQVVGIDISEDMLKIARKKNKYENVRFELADAADMPFGDNSFDISCISFALHDMPREIRHKVLDEMKRVSKQSVVIDYYIPGNKLGRLFRVFIISLYESKYFKDFARHNLKQFLQQHNFKIIKEDFGLINFAEIFICRRAVADDSV